MEAAGLTEAQRATLRAFCDTIVPSIERPDDPDGFWARKASDLAIDDGVEQIIATLPPELQVGLGQLLDALAEQQFALLSQLSREQILSNVTMASADAAQGVAALAGMTLFLYYGAPDPQTGQNPNWKTLGYPGPAIPPVQSEKAITPLTPDGDELELEADVVVVGSGAGGGVIAGTLAQQGLKVVVLEAAGYFNESDFKQLELVAYQEMYWRGGPTPTADGNVSLQAGTTLGGGTGIHSTNRLRPQPSGRQHGAREPLGPRAVGARARARGGRRARLRPPPRRRPRPHRRDRRAQRPERSAAVDEARLRGAGLGLPQGRAQRRPGALLVRLGRLPRLRRPIGVEELGRQDVAARRGAERRRRARAHARRPRARGGGTGCRGGGDGRR